MSRRLRKYELGDESGWCVPCTAKIKGKRDGPGGGSGEQDKFELVLDRQILSRVVCEGSVRS